MPFFMVALFALIWLVISGSWTVANALLGLLLAATVLALVRFQLGKPLKVLRPRKIVVLAALFAVELLVSAWRVLVIVIQPKLDVQPGIILYPLRMQSDFQIALLSNLITLTPGTLTVDVSPDRSHLIIHALNCRDPDAIRADIANGFERRIMEAFG